MDGESELADAPGEGLSAYKAFFDAAPEGMALVGLDGVPVHVNASFAATLGYTPDELYRMPFADFTHPEDVRKDVAEFERLQAGEIGSYQMEKRYVTKDGRTIWVMLTVTPVKKPDGTMEVVAAQFSDITKRKDAESRVQRMLSTLRASARAKDEAAERAAAASRAKSEFIAGVSHEIRTPMNGILGMAEVLLLADLPEQQKRYVRMIKDSGAHLLNIVNDLLDLKQLESGKLNISLEGVPVASVVEQSRRHLAELAVSKGLELDVDMSRQPSGLAVRADRTRLIQVLTNLVGNAVKFTDSGRIVIEVSRDPGDGMVRIAVHDTGPGIDSEELSKIFEWFGRGSRAGKIQGAGLGLPLSRQLVEGMGGALTADSTPGAGSRFVVALPAHQDEDGGDLRRVA